MPRRKGVLVFAAALLVLPTTVGARPAIEDPHSDNIKQLARAPIDLPGDAGVADGSDLAFQGNLTDVHFFKDRLNPQVQVADFR